MRQPVAPIKPSLIYGIRQSGVGERRALQGRMNFIDIMIAIAVAAVVITLGMGFYTLYRGGNFARQRANKFMRWRVALQAVAIVLILVGLFIKKNNGV